MPQRPQRPQALEREFGALASTNGGSDVNGRRSGFPNGMLGGGGASLPETVFTAVQSPRPTLALRSPLIRGPCW